MIIAILYILGTPLFSFLGLSSEELKVLAKCLKKAIHVSFLDPNDEMQPPLRNTATAYDSE